VLPPRFIDVLGRARPQGVGVTQWSICASESRRLTLGIKDRQTGNAHTPLSLSDACGARYLLVWEDGAVSRGHFERRQLEVDVEAALETARAAAYADSDAAHVLGPAEMPEVSLHDAEAADLARGAGTLVAERLEAIRRRVDAAGFRTWSGSFSAGDSRSRVVTSAGLDAESAGTSFGWHATLNGDIGDGFSARCPESAAAFKARLHRLVDLACRLETPADRVAGGVRPVLLHPNVVESFVLSTLLDNLDGAAVEHRQGHFTIEQFGSDRPVLREDITLRIDPLQPLKRGSYRFTAEGLPAARCSFIEDGRLVQPLLDVKYARRLGRAPTPAPYAADVIEFRGAEVLEPSAALDAAHGGALVLSVLGVHTQDSASGDFSLSAPQALRIGSDGLDGRLPATISGNLFDILSADELRFVRFDDENIPGLLFPCRLDPK
jgi:PmbA protein